MKIILLLILLLDILTARENPFQPILVTPKAKQDIISLLHITSSNTPKVENKKKSLQEPIALPIEPSKKSLTSNELTVGTSKFHRDFSEDSTIKKTPSPTSSIMIAKSEPIITPSREVTLKVPVKKVRKKRKYKTIYQNYFLKVKTNNKNFKIFTNDKLLRKTRYKCPTRLAFDFERLQYFHTKNITLDSPYTRKIKFGSHHHFYRITIEIHGNRRFKMSKKPYGYLVKIY